MKIAFLFPGQGAQAVGMGADIAGAYPVAAEILEKANRIVGFDLQKICFDGPANQLNTTAISQPAIFVTSAAMLEALKTNPVTIGVKADVTAGLSLGEYTALYAAGVITFEDTLILVQKRGQAMQRAADKTSGAMVSIIGLDQDKVRQLCAEASEGEVLAPACHEFVEPAVCREFVEPVNFNCPGQIVISGTKTACERAEKLAPKYGAMKAIRLEVAGAFHTEMMSSAAETLKEALSNCEISQPGNIRTIANITADYYTSADQIRTGLTKQLTSPILWQKCMERLLADGVETFYEIGPGRVLTGLMKRINRKANIINVSSAQSLNEISMR
jgi:[acyl-carrier-protein] S-malonyltransferase